MTYYVPGLGEKDPDKTIRSLMQAHENTATNTTNIAANTASIATLNRNGVFQVDRNGTNQTALTATADNKVVWTTERADAEGWFDLSTGKYQPLNAGTYAFYLQVNANTGTSGETPQVVIYKNGSIYRRGLYFVATAIGAGAAFNGILTSVIAMNGTTDYVEAYCYLPTGTTVINGFTIATNFQGFRAGA